MQSLSCDLWLMERNAFRQFLTFAANRPRIEDETAAVVSSAPRQQKAIGIVPILGPLEARPSVMGYWFRMTSYQAVGELVQKYAMDDAISHIVLDMASPGGMVYGCQECAQIIYEARARKPVIAVVNPMAASGCYWLAAAATRIVMMGSSDTGSVGVISEHVDISKSLEEEGIKITVIRSDKSPFKQEGNDTEPLSDAARANMQMRADEIYSKFVADLARFRGVSVDHVNANFGQGRLVDSKRALAAKMVDRIGTLDDTLTRIMEGRFRLGSEAAMDVWDAPTMREQLNERIAAFETAATITEAV